MDGELIGVNFLHKLVPICQQVISVATAATLFRFQHFLNISMCEENEATLPGKMEENHTFKENNEIWVIFVGC